MSSDVSENTPGFTPGFMKISDKVYNEKIVSE